MPGPLRPQISSYGVVHPALLDACFQAVAAHPSVGSAVNGGLLAVLAILLIVTPVTISAPIKLEQALIIIVVLAVTLGANALLLRRVVAPLDRLARRMETVDLLRRGQRLEVRREDEIGRVVRAFNQMLDRLEDERQQSARRILAAQEAERIGIARRGSRGDGIDQVKAGAARHC